MPQLNKQTNFDPMLIISQIFIIFWSNCFLLTFFTLLFNSILGIRSHILQLLSSDTLDLSTNYGYSYILSTFFASVPMMIIYIYLIDKANKILDYVLSNFLIQLIMITIFSSFPTNLLWWLFNGAVVSIITLISEYVSLKIERKEISLDFVYTENKV